MKALFGDDLLHAVFNNAYKNMYSYEIITFC